MCPRLSKGVYVADPEDGGGFDVLSGVPSDPESDDEGDNDFLFEVSDSPHLPTFRLLVPAATTKAWVYTRSFLKFSFLGVFFYELIIKIVFEMRGWFVIGWNGIIVAFSSWTKKKGKKSGISICKTFIRRRVAKEVKLYEI